MSGTETRLKRGDDLDVMLTRLKRGDGLDVMLFYFLLVPSFLLYGWILKVMWGLFVVPTFGLEALSIRNALGLALIAGLLRTGKGLDKNKLLYRSLIESMIAALLILGIAFVVEGLRF